MSFRFAKSRAAEFVTILNSKNFQISGWKFTLKAAVKRFQESQTFCSGKDLMDFYCSFDALWV